MGGYPRAKLAQLEVSSEVHRAALARARELRKAPTRSEALLWEALRNRRLGSKFRRQQWVGPFILDFFCPEFRLAIEVDGRVHEDQRERDRERQELLESLGYRFLRLSAEEVERDLQGAIVQICAALTGPSPRDGEG